jgi:predicted nucleotidyltransferase
MDKTFAAYLPQIRQQWLDERDSWATRRQTAWADAQKISAYLRTQFGATQVLVFGSLIDTGLFDGHSDIDIAVRGIPAPQFFQAVTEIMSVSQTFSVDLIDLDTCSETLRQIILRDGKPV